jgi:hypothetical protein
MIEYCIENATRNLPKKAAWRFIHSDYFRFLSMTQESNYPLSDHFTLGFSAYEDRLLLSTQRGQFGAATLLLTRRMTVLVIRQLLSKLPDLSGLEQTPHAYWQEVLQMAHQRALAEQASSGAKEAAPDSAAAAEKPSGGLEDNDPPTDEPDLYLATEITSELREKQLLLAFKGLPLPKAMRTSCSHEPVVAFTLEPEQVHQFLDLIIVKSTEAQWHLPLDLPWLEPVNIGVSAKTTSH